jgi:error-prone DNA polymerase
MIGAPLTSQHPALAGLRKLRVKDFENHLIFYLPRSDEVKLSSASELRDYLQGRRARAAGIVVGRQRPDTASGVIFVTLEDETGCINVIVWWDVADRQRRELLGSRLMAVEGVLEREGEVVHVIARKLTDHSALLGQLQTKSRDFH